MDGAESGTYTDDIVLSHSREELPVWAKAHAVDIICIFHSVINQVA